MSQQKDKSKNHNQSSVFVFLSSHKLECVCKPHPRPVIYEGGATNIGLRPSPVFYFSKWMPNVSVISQTWHVLNRCACACARQSPCDLYEDGCGRRGDLGPTQPKQMKLITSFMRLEEEKRLKFYLIKGVWAGGYPVLARGCKHETSACLWFLWKNSRGPRDFWTSTEANSSFSIRKSDRLKILAGLS